MRRDETDASAAEAPGPLAPKRPYLSLLTVSFTILFFELACIRWFGSTVIFLSYFTNIVLIACFLGMSVGLLSSRGPIRLSGWVVPLMLLGTVAAVALNLLYDPYGQDGLFTVDVGGQKRDPQEIFFGTESSSAEAPQVVLPIELLAGTFFSVITLTFLGLGQIMGRAFTAIENRVAAYSVDILGSLVGIVAFGVASWFQTPPALWFGLSLGLAVVLARGYRIVLAILALLVVGVVSLNDLDDWWPKNPINQALDQPSYRTRWSPYYKVEWDPQGGHVYVNNMYHQRAIPVDWSGSIYTLPHLLNRDAGQDPFHDVLVIGAGSGNDVSAALLQGAESVDAVEIDPVIQQIGREVHPNRPYSDPRVRPQNDDGRGFVRRTDREYDLIIYALVDSLRLHSGYASIRLESFLFTRQALEDLRDHLAEDGVVAMYNYYRQGWVVGRLERLCREVFGTEPLIFSLPYEPRIGADDSQSGKITFVLAGRPGNPHLEAIREAFREHGTFWACWSPRYNMEINGYGAQPPESDVSRYPWMRWQQVAPAEVVTDQIRYLPSDDWPFLYLREPRVPGLSLRGIVLIGLLSSVILAIFFPWKRGRSPGLALMFFLGAGFMLLETKGVVHMAVLFGSTWVVNSVVFFAILCMVLLANLYVIAFRPRKLRLFFAGLGISLLLNALVPLTVYLALPGVSRVIVSCLVVFLPIFFAGVIFASAFRVQRDPDIAFGANIAGVIVGGLTEYLSLVLGFSQLVGVALAFYALGYLFGGRQLDSGFTLPSSVAGESS